LPKGKSAEINIGPASLRSNQNPGEQENLEEEATIMSQESGRKGEPTINIELIGKWDPAVKVNADTWIAKYETVGQFFIYLIGTAADWL
jgi:hypothetical protein